eukprot:COSAG05_NODE_5803_length_1084_cov_2.014213_1_plen_134_part_10
MQGILFDRFTMVRVRKVLERYSKGGELEGLIDMHTGNDFTYAGQKITDAVQYANHVSGRTSTRKWFASGCTYVRVVVHSGRTSTRCGLVKCSVTTASPTTGFATLAFAVSSPCAAWLHARLVVSDTAHPPPPLS